MAKINGILSDFGFDLARGRISGLSVIHKFGRNPDVDSGFESVWGGGGDYTGFDAVAAETVEVFSSDAADTSAGTGARTVEVFGLDANCNVRFAVRPLGEVFQVKEEFSVQGAGSSYTPLEYVTLKGPYAAKTDIRIEADTDTVNTGIAANFELYLLDD